MPNLTVPPSEPHPQEPEVLSPALKGAPATEAADKQSNAKGVEILSQPHEEIKTPLSERKIIKAESTGAWASIKRFFSRHFSKIPAENTQKASEIKTLSSEIEHLLDKVDAAAQKAKRMEKKVEDVYPTLQTAAYEETFLEESKSLLDEAELLLIQLQAKKEEAHELAEAHSAFDSLPTRINALEMRLSTLEGRRAIGEQLVVLERAMAEYLPEKKWSQFAEITKQRRALCVTIQNSIRDNLSFKSDSYLKKYAEKSSLSAVDAHEVIQHMHPDAKGYVERLFNSTLKIIDGRFHALNQKVDEMIPLFNKHKQLSKQINELESSLYDKSLLSRIYRLFHNPETLRAQLQEAKRQLSETFSAIQDKGHFDPEELLWVQQKAKNDPNCEVLMSDLSDINHGVNYLKLREPISTELSQLIQKLSEYNGAKIAERQAESASYKKIAQGFVKKVKEEVVSDFEALAPLLKLLKEKKKASLPSQFDTFDAITQFKVLIPLAFPSLKVKAQILSDLIEEMDLKSDYNHAIEVAESGAEEILDEEILSEGKTTPRVEESPVVPSIEAKLAAPVAASVPVAEVLPTLSPPAATSKPPSPPPPPISGSKPPPPPPPPKKVAPIAASPYEEIEGGASKASEPSDVKKIEGELVAEETMLDQIKQAKLKKGAEKKGLILPAEEEPTVLGDIKKGGFKLKHVEESDKVENVVGGKTVRTFKELEKLLREGKIKLSDVTAEEKDGLSLFQHVALRAASDYFAHHGGSDESEIVDPEQDKEWL